MGLVGHTVPCGDKENVMICQRSNSSGNTHAVARKEGQITLELVGGKVRVFNYTSMYICVLH